MNTEYTTSSTQIKVRGNQYTVTRFTRPNGSQYINIVKDTNNVWRSLGKDFDTENEAIANYKSAAMKAALIQIFPTI